MSMNPLQKLGFHKEDGSRVSGLVPITESEQHLDPLRVDEIVAVASAASFRIIDFAYFRRFVDGRSSQLAAYIVDNSDNSHTEEELARLHLKVWRQGTVPLLYIAWPTRIDILMCGRDADFWRNDECEYHPAKRLELAADISDELKRFSVHRLADGTFWEDPENWSFTDYKRAAHHSLIQAIVEADKDLQGKKRPVMRRLLLLMVLIKYLEDRGVFPGQGWFGKFHKGARSFFDVLKSENSDAVYRLLGVLEDRFNGDVFELDSEQKALTAENLRVFADLVEARTLKKQRYLWEQHSFSHLPVEIISHLYQYFVPGGQGAIYTPPFLASLLLDSVMPYGKLTGRERVLDPSCGSGVFLVGAFRRLINVWRKKNDWCRPDVVELKRLLRECIFGVEMDTTAVDLTAFSLSLAICDALRPEVIWNELRFERLRDRNLVHADFFEAVLESERETGSVLAERYDVIVGNPPFMNNNTDAGRIVENAAKRRDPSRGDLPDKNVAYLFLEQSMQMLRTGGRTCLLQPKGILYNAKTGAFRRSLFKRHKFRAIHDFVSIRNLYDADTKTVAVEAIAGQPEPDHFVIHYTYRRTASVHQRIGFELDHYDYHRVPQHFAVNDPYVWRANLLGGGRLLNLSMRLREMPTLAEFVAKRQWDYGEGFIAGSAEPRIEANFLTGLPLLPTDAFTEEGIDSTQIGEVLETRFRSPYSLERFSPPLVLIKGNENLPIAYWNRGPLAFRATIVGIHAPEEEADQLSAFYSKLRERHEAYRFCSLMHGTAALTEKATVVRKQDIDVLPFPESDDALSLAFWEEVLTSDVIGQMAEFIRRGQNSPLLRYSASREVLTAYSELYVRMLGSIYDNLRAAEPIFLDGLICQPFYFGDRPELSWVLDGSQVDLERLIYDENKHANLRTIRVLKIYDQNTILIVKPDRLRYWIGSTAIRDADETLTDLAEQGY